MKEFTCSVDISSSRDNVIEIWKDPNQLKNWQEGFLGSEHITGGLDEVGSKTKLLYRVKGSKKEFDLIETILINELPNRYVGEYAGPGMVNTMDNQFIALSDNNTRWEARIEYKEIKGFLKVMAVLMPGMFKKQTQRWLDRFKVLVEEGSKAV